MRDGLGIDAPSAGWVRVARPKSWGRGVYQKSWTSLSLLEIGINLLTGNYLDCDLIPRHLNKQTNKQTNKKKAIKQTNKQTISKCSKFGTESPKVVGISDYVYFSSARIAAHNMWGTKRKRRLRGPSPPRSSTGGALQGHAYVTATEGYLASLPCTTDGRTDGGLLPPFFFLPFCSVAHRLLRRCRVSIEEKVSERSPSQYGGGGPKEKEKQRGEATESRERETRPWLRGCCHIP
jgi:hypothetical protein